LAAAVMLAVSATVTKLRINAVSRLRIMDRHYQT
jgi:hypothetical protein